MTEIGSKHGGGVAGVESLLRDTFETPAGPTSTSVEVEGIPGQGDRRSIMGIAEQGVASGWLAVVSKTQPRPHQWVMFR